MYIQSVLCCHNFGAMEEVIEPMPRAFVQQPSAVAQAVIQIETAPPF